MKNFIFLSICCVFLLFGCDKPEQIPAYIRIEPFAVLTTEGAAYQDIREGWIFVNGELLGAYSLPGDVPVLAVGDADVEIAPGIKENGIANTPNIYTPLTRYKTMVTLIAAQTSVVSPNTTYDSRTTVPNGGREDFEGGSTIPLEDSDFYPATSFKIENGGKFGHFLKLEMDTVYPENSVNMAAPMEGIPVSGGQEVWMELHHQNNMPFTLYLLASNAADPNYEVPIQIFTFNPSEDWNKIYINLTDFISSTPYNQYAVAFRAFLPKDFNGKFTQDAGQVSIDNIKIVHY